MALKNLSLAFFFLCSIQSVGAETFYVSNPSCLVLEKRNIEWVETNAPIIPYGESIQGEPSAKRPDIIIVQRNDKVYAYPRNCLQTEEEKQNEIIIGGLPLPSYLPPPPSLIRPTQEKKREASRYTRRFFWSVFASINSWQEEFKLKSSTASHDLRTTIVGYNFGGRLSYKINPLWTVDADLSHLFGNREISATTSAVTYHTSNGNVYGTTFTPRIRFNLPNQPLITLALSVPTVYRYFDVPVPPGQYTVEENFPIFTGFLFETRFRYRRIQITPQIGLFRELSSLAWALEVAYIF